MPRGRVVRPSRSSSSGRRRRRRRSPIHESRAAAALAGGMKLLGETRDLAFFWKEVLSRRESRGRSSPRLPAPVLPRDPSAAPRRGRPGSRRREGAESASKRPPKKKRRERRWLLSFASRRHGPRPGLAVCGGRPRSPSLRLWCSTANEAARRRRGAGLLRSVPIPQDKTVDASGQAPNSTRSSTARTAAQGVIHDAGSMHGTHTTTAPHGRGAGRIDWAIAAGAATGPDRGPRRARRRRRLRRARPSRFRGRRRPHARAPFVESGSEQR